MADPTQLPVDNNPWHGFIRFVILSLVRLFYPRIELQGREKLSATGPVIFVLNHPNGLIDPMLLMIALERPVTFLAMSPLFSYPVLRTLLEAFGALPVYRRQDEGQRGGARGDMARRNEVTFARCRALLRQGRAVALFPEGTTHSGAQMLPLRTGAARIALSAEAEANGGAGIQLAPVGLWYQNKTLFRTAALLVVGQPFDLTAYAESYAADEYQTVQTVTERIEAGLDQVVLQAENAELLAAIPVVAAWTAPTGEPLTLPQQHEWTTKLLAAYEHLHRTDPARLEIIAQQARRYANALRTLGINDPWALELAPARQRRLIGLILRLVLSFPLALAGFLLSYGPYRLAAPIAKYVVGPHDTQLSTAKLVGGSFLVLLGWLVVALACGLWFGGWWGLLLFIAAPPLAYTALRWGEDWRELYELISSDWLRWQRGHLVQTLIAQRRALAKQVMEAVQAM